MRRTILGRHFRPGSQSEKSLLKNGLRGLKVSVSGFWCCVLSINPEVGGIGETTRSLWGQCQRESKSFTDERERLLRRRVDSQPN